MNAPVYTIQAPEFMERDIKHNYSKAAFRKEQTICFSTIYRFPVMPESNMNRTGVSSWLLFTKAL